MWSQHHRFLLLHDLCRSQLFSSTVLVGVVGVSGGSRSSCDLSTHYPQLYSWGLVNWIFAFPAVWTIDTFGRRNLLLFTFPNMAWSLLAAGLCFLIPETNSARVPLIAFFIFVFGGEWHKLPLSEYKYSDSFDISLLLTR